MTSTHYDTRIKTCPTCHKSFSPLGERHAMALCCEQVKAAGLKSLAELASMVRKPPHTLRNWHRYNPELFAAVVAGAVVLGGG